MRIRYVLLQSIGQFVAPVRVSLTLISQNAGIYSVLSSPISLFVAPVRVSWTLISQNAGIYSVLLSSISWFGWSAGSKKVVFAPRRL